MRAKIDETSVDEIDRRILSVLIDNSKTQLKRLSRNLRIHPNTVLKRLKKLECNDVLLKYSAIVNFAKIDNGIRASILIDVDTTQNWEDALRPLSRLPEVVSFLLMAGDHNALVMARVKNEGHLMNLLRKFHATKVVKKITTNLVLDAYRESYEYNPLRDEFRF
jgi:DNA-binding Lrp family transcriptional regulator